MFDIIDGYELKAVSTPWLLKSSSIFWDKRLCSQLKVSRCFGGKHRLQLQGESSRQADLCKKISSETSSDFQRTTHRYIAEIKTFHYLCYENIKSYTMVSVQARFFISSVRADVSP
jgi:hypothetical protein